MTGLLYAIESGGETAFSKAGKVNSKPPAGDESFDGLTAERLRGLLHYDSSTGVFTWRVAAGYRVHAGDVAGRGHHDGYRRIKVMWKEYGAHRLAFLYMTSRWPRNQIDHRNLNRADNRWCNLREATPSQNNSNSRARGMSGVKGAYRHKLTNKWVSEITAGEDRFYLGLFDTKEAAGMAYRAEAERLFGEFARPA
jgi:hypothetical protein